MAGPSPFRAYLADRFPGHVAAGARTLFLVFLLLPFVIAIPVSFSPHVVFPPSGFTVRWYDAFFSSDMFNKAWKVSVVLAVASSALSTAAGACFALAISRFHIRGKVFLTNLALSPLVIPGVAIGIGLVFLFASIGLLEGWTRLILAHAIVTTPYSVRVIAATLHGFDRSLEEAAMNLGAPLGRAFRTITLPIVRPGIAAAFLFSFMSSLDNLSVTVFVAQPGYYTIPVVLFGYVRDRFDPIIAVATVIMVGIAALAMFLADRIVGIDRFIQLQSSQR
jgi:putative spermidine/putrescine transport system permease protein